MSNQNTPKWSFQADYLQAATALGTWRLTSPAKDEDREIIAQRARWSQRRPATAPTERSPGTGGGRS
jgi:hypothetical protein